MTGLTTIQCPNCQRSLPANAQTCHFCGAALTNVARPVVQKKVVKRGGAPWIWTLYYLVASYWVLEGLVIMIAGIVLLAAPADQVTGGFFQAIGGIVLAIGAFIALVGTGLILKWEWCRGVANVFSWLRILGGLWRLKDLIFAGLFMRPGALIMNFFFTIVGLVAAGLQIWLLSETD